VNIYKRLSGFFKKGLQTVSNSNAGWFPIVSESYAGAWQIGDIATSEEIQKHGVVFACVSLIASDIAKLPLYISQNTNGIWTKTSSEFDLLFRQPNSYQTRAQFVSAWLVSKLLNGNTYVLKIRNGNGRVIGLKIIDPKRVKVLVDDDSVFYEITGGSFLQSDGANPTIPAREIIHDRGICLNHPLVGVSPLTAAAVAASQGLAIQTASSKFFSNGSKPSGVLTAPGAISPDTAARIKAHWDTEYSGEKAGKVAVLGDAMRFESMTMNAVDSQLLEQLQFSDRQVCTAFGIPAWKVGIGDMPTYNGSEAGQLHYFQTTIQALLESAELCLDIGLELPITKRTEFDTNELLRLDTATRFDGYTKAIGAGWMAPNEARARESMQPVEGGDTPLIQQQNYSLAAIAKRDLQGVPA
jgi:HK97 family phage portal protein